MGVNVVKLKDVIDRGTSNLSANKLDDNNGDYPVYGATGLLKNIDFFQQDKEYLAIIKDGAGVGRVYHYPAKSSVLGTMQYLFPKENINIRFAYYFLKSLDFKKYTCGAAIPHIYYKDYCNETLSLPSMEEQNRVVSILDKADEIRTKKRLTNDKLDEFLKSTFISMFGDINNKTALSKYISSLTAGKSLAGEEDCNNKVLNTSSVTLDKFDKKQYKNYPLYYIPQEEHKARIGDVIISRMNTPALVGTVGYIWEVDDNIYLPDRLWKANVTDKVNPIFLWQLLIQPATKIEIQKIATGTSGSMKNISKEKFLKLSVLDVTLEQQNKFAQIVEKVEAQKQKNEQVIEQMDNLFNSLSQRAFKGELIPQDPNDKPIEI